MQLCNCATTYPSVCNICFAECLVKIFGALQRLSLQALCARIGIMAGGQLRCLGTQLHLKSKVCLLLHESHC